MWQPGTGHFLNGSSHSQLSLHSWQTKWWHSENLYGIAMPMLVVLILPVMPLSPGWVVGLKAFSSISSTEKYYMGSSKSKEVLWNTYSWCPGSCYNSDSSPCVGSVALSFCFAPFLYDLCVCVSSSIESLESLNLCRCWFLI